MELKNSLQQPPPNLRKTKTILMLNLTSITLSLTLLPTLQLLGLTGLAIIRGTSITITFAQTLYAISKTIKIEIDRQSLWKTLTASTTMAITVTTTQQILYNRLLLPLYIAIGATTYAITTRTLKTMPLKLKPHVENHKINMQKE